MTELKIALCQMCSTDRVEANFAQILDLLYRVSPESRVVCFPENCLYLRIDKSDPVTSFTLEEPIFRELEHVARTKNIGFFLGSVPVIEDNKLYNSTIFIEPDKKSKIVYRKIHLFDVDVEGEKPQRESETFAAGSEPSVLNYLNINWGLSICYDLRFSELYRAYAKAGCEIILVPSAFLVTTGQAHWHTLLRARAIECQAFVVASAQSGEHAGKGSARRQTFGHSVIVDPWGTILVEVAGNHPEIVEVTLDLQRVANVRRAIPMAQHRRLS